MRGKVIGVIVAALAAAMVGVVLPGTAMACTAGTATDGTGFSVGAACPGNPAPSNAGGGQQAPAQQYQNYDVPAPNPDDMRGSGKLNSCGAVVNCKTPGDEAADAMHRMAGAAPAPVVNPLTVAQSVATGMQIQPIEIGMAPEPVKGGVQPVGLIGLPIWWWVANPSENTVGPITRTATSGALTVNVNAVNTGIVFTMTDGGPPIPCAAHATIPYTELFMGLPSPVCGRPMGALRTSIHDPGGTFTVTATSLWIVTWSAWTGPTPIAGGTFPMTPTATATARFGEVQVLTGGG